MMLLAGGALTTFNKGPENLAPKVIALRSLQYTSGEMLYNPEAYAEFKAKIKINDEVLQPLQDRSLRPLLPYTHAACSWQCSLSALCVPQNAQQDKF